MTDDRKQAQGSSGTGQENEGEGNRTAAKKYDQDAQRFAELGKVDEKAREAREAIDGPEGEESRMPRRKASSTARARIPKSRGSPEATSSPASSATMQRASGRAGAVTTADFEVGPHRQSCHSVT